MPTLRSSSKSFVNCASSSSCVTNKSSPVEPLTFRQGSFRSWHLPGSAGITLHFTSTTLLYSISGVTIFCENLMRDKLDDEVAITMRSIKNRLTSMTAWSIEFGHCWTHQIEDIRSSLITDKHKILEALVYYHCHFRAFPFQQRVSGDRRSHSDPSYAGGIHLCAVHLNAGFLKIDKPFAGYEIFFKISIANPARCHTGAITLRFAKRRDVTLYPLLRIYSYGSHKIYSLALIASRVFNVPPRVFCECLPSARPRNYWDLPRVIS